MPVLPASITDHFVDPDADPPEDRARLRFAAMFVTMGILHFVVPSRFVAIVPRWVRWRREAVLVSGAAEIASGALLAVPRTRRLGGWVAAATLVSVYPANVQMAIDTTRHGSPTAAVLAWGRLPLQLPMILRALRFTR